MKKILCSLFFASLGSVSFADQRCEDIQEAIDGTSYYNRFEDRCCPNFLQSQVKPSLCIKANQHLAIDNCFRSGGNVNDSGGCDNSGHAEEEADSGSVANNNSSSDSGGKWSSCADDYATASVACKWNERGEMDGVNQLIAQQSASDPKSVCGSWGQISVEANKALGLFKGYCGASYGTCSSSCAKELEAVKAARTAHTATDLQVSEVRKFASKCEALQQNIAGAMENMRNVMAANKTMKECETLLGGSLTEQCAKNPSAPMCAFLVNGTDCSNPQVASTNVICQCRVNPSLRICQGQKLGDATATGLANFSTPGLSGADGLGNAKALGSFGGPGDGIGGGGVGIGSEGKPDQGDGRSLVRGSAGNSKAGESGGANNKHPGKDPGGGAGGSSLNTKTIAGWGYAGGGSGGGSGGSGSGSQSYDQNGNRYGQNGNGPNVDLRQFMPGGQRDPSRGLAGISGPDGITGPNSNIWQKINVRYYAVSPSLLP